MIRYFVALSLVFLASACTDRNINRLAAGLTGSAAYVDARLKISSEAISESKRAKDSADFLLSRDVSQKNECSTNLEKEQDLTRKRFDAYFKLFEYLTALSNKFASQEIKNPLGYVFGDPINGDFDQLDAVFNLNTPGAAISWARTAARAGRLIFVAGRTELDRVRILAEATRMQNDVGKGIDDFLAGLRSLEVYKNSSIKKWETCEYEKLEYFRSQMNFGESQISLERRYLEFWDKREILKTNIFGDQDKIKEIESIKCLHGNIVGKQIVLGLDNKGKERKCPPIVTFDDAVEQLRTTLQNVRQIRDQSRFVEGAYEQNLLLSRPSPRVN
jgi:hypothetical protein